MKTEQRVCCDCGDVIVEPKYIRCEKCLIIKMALLPKDFFKKETGLGLIIDERIKVQRTAGRGEADDLWLYPNRQLTKVVKEILFTQNKPPLLVTWNFPKWNPKVWTKIINSSYKRRLVIAGQLICAELDRIITTEA